MCVDFDHHQSLFQCLFFHTHTPDETALWSKTLAQVLEKVTPSGDNPSGDKLVDSPQFLPRDTVNRGGISPHDLDIAAVTVCLHGDLGAGKTVIAQGMIGHWCQAYDVSSPTFNIVTEYALRQSLCRGDTTKAMHIDLYRVHDAQEIEELDPAQWWQHYCIIEWAHNMPTHLWPHTLFASHLPRIDITIAPSPPKSHAPVHNAHTIKDTSTDDHRYITLRAPKDFIDVVRQTHLSWLALTPKGQAE